MNKLDIINRALARLRQQPLENLNGADNISSVVNRDYEPFIEYLYALYPWSHAMNKATLNKTDKPLNEYENAFILPREALRVWAVMDGASIGRGYGAVYIDDYDIQAQGDNKVLLANCDSVIAEFVIREDEALFPVLFRELVIVGFAASICQELTGNDELYQRLYAEAWGTPSQQLLGGRMAVASSADTQQKPATKIPDLPLVSARRGRGNIGGF